MLLDLDYFKSGVGQSRRSENSVTESQNVFPRLISMSKYQRLCAHTHQLLQLDGGSIYEVVDKNTTPANSQAVHIA